MSADERTYELVELNTAAEHWQAGDAVFADIRDPQSFAMGHIPGAQRVDKNAPIIVVCYHGISSQGAAEYIAAQGFTNVSSMNGGFTAWSMSYPEHVNKE